MRQEQVPTRNRMVSIAMAMVTALTLTACDEPSENPPPLQGADGGADGGDVGLPTVVAGPE